MRSFAVADAMTCNEMVALVQGGKYKHWAYSFSSHTLSDRPRHTTPQKAARVSKRNQKAVKDSSLLHTASVSSFLTDISDWAVLLVFPEGTAAATACYSNVVWTCLENDQSCRSTSAWLLLALSRHGLPWPSSLQGRCRHKNVQFCILFRTNVPHL